MTPPLIKGGQGRSDDDVRADGSVCAFLAWLAILGVIGWGLVYLLWKSA